MQGMWVWSVVGKVGFHMPLHVAKQKQNKAHKNVFKYIFLPSTNSIGTLLSNILCCVLDIQKWIWQSLCPLDFIVFYKRYSCLLKKLEIKVKINMYHLWYHNPWITTVNILVWSLSTTLCYHPKEVILCIPFVICSLLCHLLTRKYLSIW